MREIKTWALYYHDGSTDSRLARRRGHAVAIGRPRPVRSSCRRCWGRSGAWRGEGRRAADSVWTGRTWGHGQQNESLKTIIEGPNDSASRIPWTLFKVLSFLSIFWALLSLAQFYYQCTMGWALFSSWISLEKWKLSEFLITVTIVQLKPSETR